MLRPQIYNEWTLGIPFLRAFYTVFDLNKSSRIGLINLHDLPEATKTSVQISSDERKRQLYVIFSVIISGITVIALLSFSACHVNYQRDTSILKRVHSEETNDEIPDAPLFKFLNKPEDIAEWDKSVIHLDKIQPNFVVPFPSSSRPFLGQPKLGLQEESEFEMNGVLFSGMVTSKIQF